MTIVTSVLTLRSCNDGTMTEHEEISRWIGERIRNRRVELGLSHEQLAVKAGLNRSTISLYESGNRVPTITSALRVAAALDVRLSDMIAELENRA